jgi:hypothetical protein
VNLTRGAKALLTVLVEREDLYWDVAPADGGQGT